MKLRILNQFREIQIALDNELKKDVLRDIILVNLTNVSTLLHITNNKDIVFADKLLDIYHDNINSVGNFPIKHEECSFNNINLYLQSLGYEFNLGI